MQSPEWPEGKGTEFAEQLVCAAHSTGVAMRTGLQGMAQQESFKAEFSQHPPLFPSPRQPSPLLLS